MKYVVDIKTLWDAQLYIMNIANFKILRTENKIEIMPDNFGSEKLGYNWGFYI